ncbi:hypothetical protein Rs2_26446 [Raphanus sativus]|nr:hypothetical protein Rs2_26446 [Raphanus sativus]
MHKRQYCPFLSFFSIATVEIHRLGRTRESRRACHSYFYSDGDNATASIRDTETNWWRATQFDSSLPRKTLLPLEPPATKLKGSIMNIEESSKRRPFYCSPDDDDYYDEQTPDNLTHEQEQPQHEEDNFKIFLMRR